MIDRKGMSMMRIVADLFIAMTTEINKEMPTRENQWPYFCRVVLSLLGNRVIRRYDFQKKKKKKFGFSKSHAGPGLPLAGDHLISRTLGKKRKKYEFHLHARFQSPDCAKKEPPMLNDRLCLSPESSFCRSLLLICRGSCIFFFFLPSITACQPFRVARIRRRPKSQVLEKTAAGSDNLRARHWLAQKACF